MGLYDNLTALIDGSRTIKEGTTLKDLLKVATGGEPSPSQNRQLACARASHWGVVVHEETQHGAGKGRRLEM